MTNKPNDVRVVPVELLEQLRNVCGDPELWQQATDALAQTADQQGEPIALSEDVREYLQEGIENATGCEDSDVDYDFAEELAMLLGPLYRHAQLAPLQAELTRMNAMFDELATAVGFSKERCEQAGDSPLDCANQLKARCDELEVLLREVVSLDPRGEFMGWQLDGRIDAALSKPAGSERVCHLCRGEGRVGGPAPDEGGGKNCGLCGGTGMEVQS